MVGTCGTAFFISILRFTIQTRNQSKSYVTGTNLPAECGVIICMQIVVVASTVSMLIDGINDFFVLDEKKARAHKKGRTKSQQVQNRGRIVGKSMKECIKRLIRGIRGMF